MARTTRTPVAIPDRTSAAATPAAGALLYVRGSSVYAKLADGTEVSISGSGSAPANMVTTDTAQTVTGTKTFAGSTGNVPSVQVGAAGLQVLAQLPTAGILNSAASNNISMLFRPATRDDAGVVTQQSISLAANYNPINDPNPRLTTSASMGGASFIASGLTGATLASRYVGAVASVAPTTGTFAAGDYVIARNGNIFVCTTAGTPGTWGAVGGTETLPASLLDAKGDLVVATADNTPARLPIGAEGTVPVARAAAATGIAWETPAAGGGNLVLQNGEPVAGAEDILWIDMDEPAGAASGTSEVIEPYVFFLQGTALTAQTGKSRIWLEHDYQLLSARIVLGTPYVGTTLWVDVNRNDTSIFADQAHRPKIVDEDFGTFTGTSSVVGQTLAAGGYITVDLDSVGGSQSVSDMTVTLRLKRL